MRTVFNKIFIFFDRLEDHIRSILSRHPVLYSLIGGIALIVFWHGIDVIIDSEPFFSTLWGGVILVFVSLAVLLLIGILVSFFIGDTVIISGLKHEKKEIEKTGEELIAESHRMNNMDKKLGEIFEIVKSLQEKVK